MIIRVMIDEQNDADTWWKSGGRELWDKYEHTRDKYNFLNLDEETAAAFFKEAELIPGWDDPEAPPWAPYPLDFQTDTGEIVWFENGKFVISK